MTLALSRIRAGHLASAKTGPRKLLQKAPKNTDTGTGNVIHGKDNVVAGDYNVVNGKGNSVDANSGEQILAC